MILCSALYYPGSIARGDLIIRDNRFYGGKYAETFPVWWQYVRRHYPEVPVVLFADAASPVQLSPLLEHWFETEATSWTHPVRTQWLTAHAGQYFRPMQRNLVEAIILAYRANEDLFWLDSDAFLATDIHPLVAGYDVAAPSVASHQMTMDSVCTYLSRDRLHALDPLGIDLPSFLTTMLNEGPTETRMHTLQEGGLYKLFAYGRARELGEHIELTHLSCYERFMAFLKRNPLDTPEYRALVEGLPSLAARAAEQGAEMVFHDMDHGIHRRTQAFIQRHDGLFRNLASS